MWKHKKTGNLYNVVTLEAINATNSNDGEIMVVYTNRQGVFVRNRMEFLEKFTKVLQ